MPNLDKALQVARNTVWDASKYISIYTLNNIKCGVTTF